MTQLDVAAAGPAAPLLALPAVAVDLETTGLNPRRDQIVQLGAIGIHDGKVDESNAYSQLVRPAIEVPETAASVHGLRAKDLADAPTYAAVEEEFHGFLEGRVLVGYSIQFDLAMLSREAERAGLTWKEPPYLDVMLLAMGLDTLRRQPSLDDLAERYGLEAKDRHDALGDARLAAQVYVRLLQDLIHANVRTLGQARQLQRSVADANPDSDVPAWSRARGIAPLSDTADASGLARLAVDSFVYRTRLRDLVRRAVITIEADATLQAAARRMQEHGIGSLVVEPLEANASSIFTKTDLTRAMGEHGAAAAAMTVEQFASKPLFSMSDTSQLYRAIGRMSRSGVRHLAVTDEERKVVGMISLKSILRDRSLATLALGDHIENAETEAELSAAQAHLPQTVAGLLADRLTAAEAAEIISLENRAMTTRAAVLAERRMEETGRGGPPAPYSLLVLGSGGRGESLLAPDQDNALIIADSYDGNLDDEDDWYAVFAAEINRILHAAGIPLCKGDVMARNRFWRRSASEWKEQVNRWVASPQPENLLNVDIFYDMSVVHGDQPLYRDVASHARQAALNATSMLMAMSDAAADYSAPINLFGRVRADENGRTDLKAWGLLPLVSGARAMALRHGVRARTTPERFRRAAKAAGAGEGDAEALAEVHGFLLRLTLEQQIADIDAGVPTSSRVATRSLDRVQRDTLRRSLKRIELIGDLLRTAVGTLPR